MYVQTCACIYHTLCCHVHRTTAATVDEDGNDNDDGQRQRTLYSVSERSAASLLAHNRFEVVARITQTPTTTTTTTSDMFYQQKSTAVVCRSQPSAWQRTFAHELSPTVVGSTPAKRLAWIVRQPERKEETQKIEHRHGRRTMNEVRHPKLRHQL